MKRQKRKDVWTFARLVPHDKFAHVVGHELTNEHTGRAICLLCSAIQTFRVGKHKMVEHMETNHPLELEVYLEEPGADMPGVAHRLDAPLVRAVDSDEPLALRKVTAKEQQQVSRSLAKWVARHFRPLGIVEDGGFVEFVRLLTHDLGRVSLALPTRAQLGKDLVALAAHYRRLVKDDIAHFCVFFSLSSEVWTGRDGHSYIALTIHYVTDTFEARSWTLDVRELASLHDGRAIAAALDQTMSEWGLVKAYCSKLLRGSGPSIVSAATTMQVDEMACIAHSLHLVVAGALIQRSRRDGASDRPAWAEDVDQESAEPILAHHEDEDLTEEDRVTMEHARACAVDETDAFLDETLLRLERHGLDMVRAVVERFRTLATYFRKSPRGQHRLSALHARVQGRSPSAALAMQVDCPTRWSSDWEMLQRFIALEPSVLSFFAYLQSREGRVEFNELADKLQRPSPVDWLTIKCLTTLLAPFAVATDALGGQEYPTLPLVLPALSGVRKHLSRTDLFTSLVAAAGEEQGAADTHVAMDECRSALLKLFDDRFAGLQRSELVWVAYLDPRVGKRMSHLGPADKQSARDALVAAASALAREPLSDECVHGSAAQAPCQAAQDARSFMADHMFGPDEIPEQQTESDSACADEFTLYLRDIKTVKSTDGPLAWWRANGSTYPSLSRLARKWLGAMATSVPSERAFSTRGNAWTAKRCSLSPATAREVVFIAQNGSVESI